MAKVDLRTAFRTAYMLPNGQGKARAGRSGDVRPSAEWRVLFVSTGEIGLANKIAEDGRRATAGQEVRIVDIPADAGAGLGLFQNLHGYNRPQDFADALNHAAAENYGHASRLYIERLTQTLRSRGSRFDSPWSHGHGSIAERVTVKCAGLPGGLP